MLTCIEASRSFATLAQVAATGRVQAFGSRSRHLEERPPLAAATIGGIRVTSLSGSRQLASSNGGASYGSRFHDLRHRSFERTGYSIGRARFDRRAESHRPQVVVLGRCRAALAGYSKHRGPRECFVWRRLIRGPSNSALEPSRPSVRVNVSLRRAAQRESLGRQRWLAS